MSYLASLPKVKGKTRPAKRVGRGVGSGKGSHTTGKGQKGQKSRTGFNLPVGFEGGQVPLFKKMPKIKGFFSPHDVKRAVVNLKDLNVFKEGSELSPSDLLKSGLIKTIPQDGVKILGEGDIEKPLVLKGFTYSKSAVSKITAKGGKAE